jgi:hypothetical protein
LPHESAIEYVLVIIRGHVPRSVSITVKVASSRPQLSVAVPPPAINSAYVAKATGTSTTHSNVKSAGQLITGSVVSSTVIVCIH